MITEPLYLKDSYLRNIDTRVVKAEGNLVILEKTIFYATSGGQPNDTGFIYGDEKFQVLDVFKESGEIWHKLNMDFHGKTEVKLELDWERRYKHMKLHTSIHIISAIAMNEFNARITGNQIYDDYARIDFNFQEWNAELSKKIEDRANQEISKGQEVQILYMNRDEIFSNPKMVKVDPSLIPEDPVLRVIKIGDIDIQPDGGTHVKNTSEIGKLSIYKIENKGKNNKRMYFKVQ